MECWEPLPELLLEVARQLAGKIHTWSDLRATIYFCTSLSKAFSAYLVAHDATLRRAPWHSKRSWLFSRLRRAAQLASPTFELLTDERFEHATRHANGAILIPMYPADALTMQDRVCMVRRHLLVDPLCSLGTDIEIGLHRPLAPKTSIYIYPIVFSKEALDALVTEFGLLHLCAKLSLMSGIN